MIIIPAVDIKDGKCVRLFQGQMNAETVFSNDPAAMATKWADEGASLIHLVDLNGAIEKKPVNLLTVRDILSRINVPVQIGGGIRDMDTIEMYMELGVERVIIGTEAIKNPGLVVEACKKYPGRIVVGIDARDGMVAIEGWTATTDISAVDLAKKFQDAGVAAINFTDIFRDGTKTGPNIEATRAIAEAISIPVVASGGISTINDIKNLLPLEKSGVTGAITGRALYEGSLVLQEAIALMRG